VTFSGNPFVAPSLEPLYGNADRLAARTSALGQAKVSGRPVPDTIARLAAVHLPAGDRIRAVADIGCGRGTSTRVLANRLSPRRLIAIDASQAMIEKARERIGATPGTEVAFLQADFHHLPLEACRYDVVAAAFCLYHSPQPATVVTEFARVLDGHGVAVLVTKDADSYRELDALVATAGLDPRAEHRESLYATAHSGNIAAVADSALEVVHVEHEEHESRFTGLDHVAAYLATNPKYDFAPGLYGNPGALASALHEWLPDRPLTTVSVVTYVVARPLGGHR
jgi:SAM-dependent methyltransferase